MGSSSPLRGFATRARPGRAVQRAGPHRPYEGSQRSARSRGELPASVSSSPLRGFATSVLGRAHPPRRGVLIAPTRVRNTAPARCRTCRTTCPHRPYEGSQLAEDERAAGRHIRPHRPYEGSQPDRHVRERHVPESSSPLRGFATAAAAPAPMRAGVLIAPTRVRNGHSSASPSCSSSRSSSPLRGFATGIRGRGRRGRRRRPHRPYEGSQHVLLAGQGPAAPCWSSSPLRGFATRGPGRRVRRGDRPHRPYEGSQQRGGHDLAYGGGRPHRPYEGSQLGAVPFLRRQDPVLIAPTRVRNANSSRRSRNIRMSSSPLRGFATRRRGGQVAGRPLSPHRPYEGSQRGAADLPGRGLLPSSSPYEGSQPVPGGTTRVPHRPCEGSQPEDGGCAGFHDRFLIAPVRVRNSVAFDPQYAAAPVLIAPARGSRRHRGGRRPARRGTWHAHRSCEGSQPARAPHHPVGRSQSSSTPRWSAMNTCPGVSRPRAQRLRPVTYTWRP